MLPPPSETAAVAGHLPWRLLMSKPAVWLLCAQYACLSYGWWFYVTWLPTYLRDARGTSVKMGALLAGLPLLLGGIGCLISAALIPADRPRDGQRRARAPHHRDRRVPRRVGVDLHLHDRPGSGEGDARPRDGRPLQRLRDAGGVGWMHGHRRAVRRDRFWRDEHVRAASPARCRLWWSATCCRGPSQNWTLTFYVSAAIYSLGADLLAVSRRTHAAGGAHRGAARGVRRRLTK